MKTRFQWIFGSGLVVGVLLLLGAGTIEDSGIFQSLKLGGKTNLISDDGSALTYNGTHYQISSATLTNASTNTFTGAGRIVLETAVPSLQTNATLAALGGQPASATLTNASTNTFTGAGLIVLQSAVPANQTNATLASLGGISEQDPLSWIRPASRTYAHVVTVSTTISNAIQSITDARWNNRYVIYVTNGVYAEYFTTKPWVDIIGQSRSGVIISNNSTAYDTILASGMGTLLANLTVYHTTAPAATQQYPLHIDAVSDASSYGLNDSVLVNCSFIANGGHGKSGIGVGLHGDQMLRCYNCSFLSDDTAGVFLHNQAGEPAPMRGYFVNCTATSTAPSPRGNGIALDCIGSGQEDKVVIYGGTYTGGDNGIYVYNVGGSSEIYTFLGGSVSYSSLNAVDPAKVISIDIPVGVVQPNEAMPLLEVAGPVVQSGGNSYLAADGSLVGINSAPSTQSQLTVRNTNRVMGLSVYNFNSSSNGAAAGFFQSAFNAGTNTSYGLYVQNISSGSGGVYGIYTTGETKNYFSGNVGINTLVPYGKFQIGGPVGSYASFNSLDANVYGAYSTRPTLNLFTTNTAAADVGGSLGFSGETGEAGTPSMFAKIKGAKEAGGSYNGYLAFSTMTAGVALLEGMRIKSDGSVGIGTTNPGALLEVGGNIRVSGTANSIQGGHTNVIAASATPQTIFYISVPNTNSLSGDIIWKLFSTDGTDTQAQTGHTLFDSVAKGTTVTAGLTSITNTAVVTGGSTLSGGLTANVATNNVLAIQATLTTSLTTTNMLIKWRIQTPSVYSVTMP